jgi:hypothetical protein
MNKSERGFETKEGKILINRELTDLDLFVKDFLEIVKKHCNYLIVSGFISISAGRVRGTEDVDILILLTDEKSFLSLFNDLIKNNFWCYQTEIPSEAYNYFKRFNNIRFARTGEMFPNIKVIPVTSEKKAKYFEFNNPQIIKIKDFEFKAPWLEFEIIYKEKILSEKKDLEDAAHLRAFFSDILDEERFRKSEEVINNEIR